jgi:hypothetical protein
VFDGGGGGWVVLGGGFGAEREAEGPALLGEVQEVPFRGD